MTDEETMDVAIIDEKAGVKTVVGMQDGHLFIAQHRGDPPGYDDILLGAVAFPPDMIDTLIYGLQNVKGFSQ